MQIRRSILWFVVLVLALIALLIWHGKKKAVEMPPITAVGTNVVPSRTNTAKNMPVNALVHSNAPVTQAALGAPIPPPRQSKEQQMREGLAELNNEDVVFYGQVIDQVGLPVTGATVSGIIQVNNGTRVGADRISTTTDGNGSFTISGYKGKDLGIHVSKTGYVMAATNTSFIYSYLWPKSQRYMPDQNNPTVIKMWKLQGAEPLVSINRHYKLPYTNAPINFDLVAGKIVSTGGDVRITVNRPAGEVSEHNPQKWSIDFEVVAGGFIETSDKEWGVTYVAPESGYQPNGTFTNNNGPGWINEAFFVQSRNGQVYSKLGLSFAINKTPDGFMDITFSGVANTNGSRNWEATATQP